MLDRINSPNACPTLAAVNLWAAAKGSKQATLDLVVQPLGIVLTGCVLRCHDGHYWVELRDGAGVKFLPGARQQFQQHALEAVGAISSLAERAR
jgi:hypothetical protein